MRNRFGAVEAEIIERLNGIEPAWRDRFETAEDAAAYYRRAKPAPQGDDVTELDPDALEYGADTDEEAI